ncbi:uncharacterized protein LOC116413124 isoform X3 [Galleria mellonella]|uniref:Uncharacterized protein LOC116413124 isoform X3 n=1 Tax=Galleria mellonella TaxID=7137 RepID=A0A6J3C0N8_GALME|nr:uncharacterized protein LOC116413124 isoform X3 [Galleria mellonella]
MRAITYEEDYNDNAYLEECKCACIRCEDTKPCCKNICTNCNFQTGQSNIVILPYLYPLVVSGMGVSNITSPRIPIRVQSTTTPFTSTMSTPTMSTTTSLRTSITTHTHASSSTIKYPAPSRRSSLENDLTDIYVDGPINTDGRNKYMLTSIRRTKPTWLPRY